MITHDLYATTPPPKAVRGAHSQHLLTLTIISHPNLTRIGEICYLHGSHDEATAEGAESVVFFVRYLLFVSCETY